MAAATAGAQDIEIKPDVSVQDPADFLIAASDRLDLLVCGSRGYGPGNERCCWAASPAGSPPRRTAR